MGKRKEYSYDRNVGEVAGSSSHKRHKKHKKHKRSKYPEEVEYEVVEEQPLDETIEVMEEIEYMEADLEPEIIAEMETEVTVSTLQQAPLQQKTLSPVKSSSSLSKAGNKKKGRTKGRDSGTSSEEERWLDAIESGKLEEVDDELKKIKPKDPKLMTARQRAMYERHTDKDAGIGTELLMSLPTGYKEKVMTAEAIQKAQLKSQKRKQMADEKREKDKRKTMERLLKKQDSKTVKAIKNRPVKEKVPVITYMHTVDGGTISLPPDVEFPLKPQTARIPPKPTMCAIPSCKNIKRYNCSKTNIPLCSYKCYKMNVDSIKQIIC